MNYREWVSEWLSGTWWIYIRIRTLMHVVDVIRSVVHIILLVIHLCVSDSVRQKNGDPFHAQFVAPQFANDVLDGSLWGCSPQHWLAEWIGSTRYSRLMCAELDWWLRSRNWQAFLLNDCLPEWFGKSTLDWLNDGPLITIIIIYLGILHHQFISFITGHILQYVTWRLEIELTSISNIYFIIVVVQVDVCFVCLLTRIMIDRLLFIPTPIPLMSHKSRTFF